jgi:hypothetical protein
MFRLLATAGALFLGLSVASADIVPEPAGVPPDVFVKGIYDTKLETEAVSPDFGRAMTDSLILNNFSAELLALYKSIYYVDEPVIDADVFMMAQEWAPTDVATKTTAETAETATVEATFKINDTARTVTFSLKKHRDSWEIDDIADSSGSLRKWIGEAKPTAPPPPG